MKIYIDFDGTLFDTDRYMSDSIRTANEYGISDVMFNKVKKELFGEKKLFNLDRMIDYFIEKYNINVDIKEKTDELLNNDYLYSEVIDCLNILVNSCYELYLLTYGDQEFQMKKINSSGINRYFKDIIITDRNKSELKLDYKDSIFIDNNPVVIEDLYNLSKNIIRIKRDSDKHTKEECHIRNIIECSDFNQVIKCLKGGFSNE